MIDANRSVSGDQAFDFIGNAAFSGALGQLRWEASTSGVTLLGNTTSDTAPGLVIKLENLAGDLLGGNSFLL